MNFKHIRIEPDGKNFRIVTKRTGMNVGGRLDTGQSSALTPIPPIPPARMTLKEAAVLADKWDKFIELGHQKKSEKKSK